MEWKESRDPVKRWISRHKVWSGIIVAVVVLGGLGALGSTEQNPRVAVENNSTPATSLNSGSDSGYESSSSSSSSSSSYESSGETNARESAESYLSHSSFSRKGLIEQLEYEGYSTAEATYAVDAVNPDWNEQAALSAKSYLSHSSFSRSGLQEQLEYEGFTPSQAAYGVSAAY